MSSLAFSIVIALATSGLVVGSVYIGSGWPGIRPQALTFVLLPLMLLAVLIGIDPLERALPDGVGTGLLAALTVVVFLVGRRRRSHETPEVTERRKLAMQKPAVRWLIAAYIVMLAVAALVLGFR